MKVLGLVCDKLEKAIENTSSILVVIITIFIGIEVVSRYLIGKSYGFLEDFSKWMMVWFSFLSAGIVLRRNQHVRIDTLEETVGPHGKATLRIFSLVATLITAIWFAWAGVLTCIKAYENQELSISSGEIPLYLIRLALPIGMIFLVIFSFELLVKNIKLFWKPKE
jgi:TRAP-type C4-dicarboxylate transport system permease small subunit